MDSRRWIVVLAVAGCVCFVEGTPPLWAAPPAPAGSVTVRTRLQGLQLTGRLQAVQLGVGAGMNVAGVYYLKLAPQLHSPRLATAGVVLLVAGSLANAHGVYRSWRHHRR